MKHHLYCKHSFKDTNINKLKLTGKRWEDRGGRSEAHVYDKNRSRVFSSYTACCVSAAKEEYLRHIDYEIKQAELKLSKIVLETITTIANLPRKRTSQYLKLMKLTQNVKKSDNR